MHIKAIKDVWREERLAIYSVFNIRSQTARVTPGHGFGVQACSRLDCPDKVLFM